MDTSLSAAPLLSRHVPVLDGVRAFAVSSVLMLHLGYGRFPGGWLGVDLFFVLSGYLITGLLLKEFNESGHLRLDLFYLRRVLRILPPLFVVLVLAAALRPWILAGPFPWTYGYWPTAAAVLFFYANFVADELGPLTPTWSLAIEEQFYLLWPAMLLFLLPRWSRRNSILLLLGGMILFSLVLRAALAYGCATTSFLATFTPVRVDCLMLGAMAAFISDYSILKPVLRRLSDWRYPEMVLLLVIVLGFCYGPHTALFFYYGGMTLVPVLFALFLLCAVTEPRPRLYQSLLQSPPAIWLGKRSYGIYLYHLPFFYALEPFRIAHSYTNLAVITLLRLALPLLMAELSYRWIEKPILHHKASLNWKHDPKASLSGD